MIRIKEEEEPKEQLMDLHDDIRSGQPSSS